MIESAYKYELLGDITTSVLSYNAREQDMRLTSTVEKLFYQSVLNADAECPADAAPSITPGTSAFNMRIVSGSKVALAFPVIVKDLTEYKIYPDGRVDIAFTYEKVNTDYRNIDVPTVPVVISDTIVYPGFMALFFAGAPDVVQDTVARYRVFRHGDVIYYAYDCITLNGRVSSDGSEYSMFTAILASTTELPSERRASDFRDVFAFYVKSRYNAEIL